MTAPIDLDALERLIAAATPGELHAPGLGEIHAEDHRCVAQVCFTANDPEVDCGTEADAELIVAAVNALPALVQELRDARRDAERYRWLREQSHPWGGKWYSLTALDAAIDAAIAASTPTTGEPK